MSIRANLDVVHERIARACLKSGRDPAEVTLVAVSKTFPLERLQAAADQGQMVFGENKAQELDEKATAWTSSDVEWHFIGHLQRNKAPVVARHADVFHALDSVRLARALDRRLEEENRTLRCLVQVNVSGEQSKFGLDPSALAPFLEEVAQFERLRIEGLMTLAAPTDDPEHVRPQFSLLRSLLSTPAPGGNTRLRALSMGMSGDFEVAIEEGATHVRVGSAIFGNRSYQ
ncbi:MAG: YggS family pyridoxal phosphate-dependent enzyme [Rhodothermales bacterium]|nr:YggS family pyridoxal phosphate-dependent enzyme [Rhodothermales bacterium]MBO6781555.1 YggS family pyridoxal phosphate-dependent enzyme [Rhodothermales bacterium]